MKKKLTPDNIQELTENQIFVFGSNMNGNHAGGAARLAVEKFGAVMGQAEGIQGQSYAIPTLDKDMQKIAEEELTTYLGNFREFTEEHSEKEFLLTAIGTGIAGFDTNYMAYMILRANLPDNVTLPKEFTKIKGYKGFNPDMTCRGFKYEEGKDYEEEGEIEACENGFHFCLHPLDVFGYYPPAYIGMNKFHEVEGSGYMDADEDDTKIACSKIHIGAKLDIKGLVKATVSYVKERCTNRNNANPGFPATAGNYGAATAGDSGAA
ncbi:A1S_2505 family phage non-structural protein, partial [Bacteroides eggerthii]